MRLGGRTLIAIVIAAVLAGCSGGDDGTAGATTTAAAGTAATTTVTDGSDAAAEATAAPQSDLPGIGDTVQDDTFAFVVTEIEQPGPVYNPNDSSLEIDEATGTWFIVHMTVENVGESTAQLLGDDQNLLWNGEVFEGPFASWNGTNIATLDPGMVLDDAVVMFDVPVDFPANGTGAVLEAHYSAFSDGTKVGF